MQVMAWKTVYDAVLRRSFPETHEMFEVWSTYENGSILLLFLHCCGLSAEVVCEPLDVPTAMAFVFVHVRWAQAQ